MKKYFSILIAFLLVLLPVKVKAMDASFWVSASSTTVTKGSNVTISYGFSASEEAGVAFKVSTSNAAVGPIPISADSFLPSKSNQSSISFTANQVGTATITFSNIQIEGAVSEELKNLGSRSVTIRVVEPQSNSDNTSNSGNTSNQSGVNISTAPPNQETRTPVDEKSSNSYLASLKINQGELSPQFNPEVFEYSVKLPADTKQITITAQVDHEKAQVQNEKTIELHEGSNKHELVVTAEDGSTRTYRINFDVEEKPKTVINYRNKNIGILNIFPENKPTGYSETEIEINQIKVKALKNDDLKTTLVYVLDENGQKRWMYVNNDKYSYYEEFDISGKKYILGFIDESVSKIGMSYKEVELFWKKIIALTYDDPLLSRFVVVPFYNDKNELNLYQIDIEENSIQRFADSFEKMNSELEKIKLENQNIMNNQFILFVIIGILSILTLGLIALSIYLWLKRKK